MIYLLWLWCWCSASRATIPGQISISLHPCLQLRGDILIKCFSKSFISSSSSSSVPGRHDLLFQCQFHTCAIPADQLKFGKCDLDRPFLDSWFSDDGQVELFFAKSPEDISSKNYYFYIICIIYVFKYIYIYICTLWLMLQTFTCMYVPVYVFKCVLRHIL